MERTSSSTAEPARDQPDSNRGAAAVGELKLAWGDRLGAGDYGEVWRAVDDLKRDVAVKFLKQGFGGVPRTEVHAHVAVLQRIDHPNVVKIHVVADLPRPDVVGAPQADRDVYLNVAAARL